MSSEQKPMQATPSADLEQQIMDPNIPKNEREHWAANEIHRLRDILNGGCPMHPSVRDRRSIDDQLVIAVNILRAAELNTALTRKLATAREVAREVLTELLRLYDWRLALAHEESGLAIPARRPFTPDEMSRTPEQWAARRKQMERDLRTYGREKKAAWIAARSALRSNDENCGCTVFDWCATHLAAIDAPAGEEAPVVLVALTPEPRVIDGKFHAEVRDGRVVIAKISSGEVVPDDEPLFLLRGRDTLALPTLHSYEKLCEYDNTTDYQRTLLGLAIARFSDYASDPSRMKQPGITRGAAWHPDEQAGTLCVGPLPHVPGCNAETPPEPANAQGSEAEVCGAFWGRCRNTKPCALHPESVPPSAPPSTAEERAHCVDCGIPYGGDDWLDLMLPDDQWELIQSPDKENGILCASCIVRRAKRVPHADAIRAVISIMPQRDDALERAAEAVVAAWGGEARNASNDLMNSKMTALYDALTAAQRAKGKQ